MKKKKTIAGKKNISSTVKKQDLKSEVIRKLKKELKIEAALEKVRARGMAMKTSDELGPLIATLFRELTKLDLALTRCVIWIIDQKSHDAVWWMANSEDPSHPVSYNIPYHKSPPWLAFMKEWKKRTSKWVYDLKGQTKKKWDDHLFSKTGLSQMPKFIQKGMRAPDRVLLSVSFNNFGGINVASLEPLSDEHFTILLRFAKVFDQTYTRFLDLQKAETQAREAQIEWALERVRARTMAMQKSGELQDVVHTIFERLKELNIEFYTAIIILFENDSKDITWWLENKEKQQYARIHVPYADISYLRDLFAEKEQGRSYFSKTYSFDQKNELFGHLFTATDFRYVPVKQRKFLLESEAATMSVAISKNTGLHLTRYTDKSFSENENEIVQRFAKVFEQAYTRFLDLQKAEAQAREAQIEAALERVRARSMAMRQSDELSDCAELLFRELTTLGGRLWSTGFAILNDNVAIDGEYRTTDQDGSREEVTYIPNTWDPTMKYLYEGWKQGEVYRKYDLAGREIRKHYTNMVALPKSGHVFRVVLDAGSKFPDWQQMHAAYFKQGYLLVISLHNYTDSDLLIRFARVFEQTYTRFLDLQKAEAQAREALIEASLERVRAKSMAMHYSKELDSVIKTVYAELKKLDVSFQRCFIMIFDEQKGATWWMGSPDGDLFHDGFHVQFHTHPPHLAYLQGWEERRQKWEYWLGGQVKKDWDEFIFTKTELSKLPPIVIQTMSSYEAANLSASFENFGCMTVGGAEKLSDESFTILNRFAKVFDLSYTRFKDLQKAEAQAREAEIELALERVRSRSIAMRRSEEIADIVGKIFIELRQLNLVLNRVLIWTFNDPEKYITWWSSNPEAESNAESYRVDYNDQPVFINFLQAWQQRIPVYLQTLSGDAKKTWEEHLFENTEMAKLPVEVRKGMREEGTIFTTSVISDYGLMMVGSYEPLSDENIDITQRFGRVFQQSYTRYLDVQKAEAQAREAEIELGLERVRARAMAMQHSGELSELVDTVFKELTKLDFTLKWCIINIIDEPSLSNTVWAANPDIDKAPESYHMLFEDYPFHHAMMKGWKERNTKCIYVIEGEEKRIYDEYLFTETEFKRVPPAAQAASRAMEKYVVTFTFSNFGGLQTVGDAPLSEANIEILSRFGKVFDLTYTRFNDLRLAEAQAREAQIETAMEKIRSRSLAMHHSAELKEVIAVFFERLSELKVLLGTIGIQLFDPKTMNSFMWVGNAIQDPQMVNLPYDKQMMQGENLVKDLWDAVTNGRDIINQEYTREQKDQFFNYIFSNNDHTQVPESARVFLRQLTNHIVCLLPEKNSAVFADSFTNEFFSDEQIRILKRASKVFEQAYIRFLDLQKAEAQAKEAQIQLALERVRAGTMAMHKSDELAAVVNLLYQQLEDLDFGLYQILISIINTDKKCIEWWSRGFGDGSLPQCYLIPFVDHPFPNMQFEKWQSGETYHAHKLDGDLKKSWEEYLFTQTDLKNLPENIKQQMQGIDQVYLSDAFMKHGVLQAAGASILPDDKAEILIRFAKVLDQAYTRMMDLQKAETQAREARIETALERIRARALAMHSSTELVEVARVMREQMALLGQPELESTVVHLYEEDPDHILSWRAFRLNTDTKSEIVHGHMSIPKHSGDFVQDWLDHFYSDEHEYTLELSGSRQDEWYKILGKLAPEVVIAMEKDHSIHEKRYYHFSKFSGGALLMISKKQPSDEAMYLLKRAAVVFDLAYRRFGDLQKAEAQAREAKIETALEKVRSRTMAMQHSRELPEAANLLFLEVQALGIPAWSCGYNILAEDKRSSTCIMSSEGALQQPFKLSLTGEASFNEWHDFLQSGETFFVQELGGKAIQEHYDFMRSLPELKDIFRHLQDVGLSLPTYQINHLVKFTSGFLLFITYEQVPEAHDIFRRFTKVFEQTYTRFLDLQKAEASTKEAVKQAALDRIRADIASMRTIRDLDRITPLIWNELTILGIPFIRCGVFIMDEDQQLVHTFLSTPDGKAIAAFHLPYDTPGNLSKAINSWRRNEKYIDHWGHEEFVQFADILAKQGALESAEKYLQTIPRGGFYLHFLPFLQGMLYVGNTEQLHVDAIRLIQAVADAFSTAYARYEDFNKLEAAKQQVDKTLIDLRQAQQQLVQSEKMASLGELTAGIAHEIQNPLNFVNNFSDVSNELLEEMKNELEKGNKDDAIAIVEDIKQNLEKILHHGKRADAIVKGMLQHSRTSSGQKEMTDINILADEYLRLAYHGLRAKDKSFNAKFETHFDDNVGKVSVIPQDIGRVILNLINNAFYAVNEKVKSETSKVKDDQSHVSPFTSHYEPTVTVRTVKNNGKVEIRVKDNGNGIPDSIKEKIFQPFFTTKPTGQGTGLGLSLSYDIVKAHGGELKAETKEGEGSEFMIQLPTK